MYIKYEIINISEKGNNNKYPALLGLQVTLNLIGRMQRRGLS